MWIDYLKTLPQYVIPKKIITTLAGSLATVTNPAIKDVLIQNFIRAYGVNMQEALQEDPKQYADFNSFFVRHLKPTCRPLAEADIVSPVDGCVSEIGEIQQGQMLQAKGHHYTVTELLTDETWGQAFVNGRFATLYLSPKDYHRVHMPVGARLREMIYVPGQLFSVQPATARIIPKLFARNKRLVVFFDTPVGLMAMVLVGATIVGAIGTSWSGDVASSPIKTRVNYADEEKVLAQADEMGYFKLGSTVILLFANQQVQWRHDLVSGSGIQFGEALGSINGS